MTSLRAFGFGSYFRSSRARDIDVLFVHQNLSRESVEFAIDAKRRLIAEQPLCDVVMLAEEEEQEQKFIRRSGAVLLRRLDAKTLETDVCDLVRTIGYTYASISSSSTADARL
jgi:hypothetical protein